MNAEHSSAFWTFPAYSFLFDKRIHSQGLDRLEIFNHAHPIFGSITFVNVLNACAWILGTVHTQPGLDIFEGFAIFDPAPHAGNRWLLGIIPVTAGAMFLFPKISHAQSAIHAAGGDEKCSDF